MRDLDNEELFHVYGAGGKGKSPCPPSKHSPFKRRHGSSSGGYGGGKRHGKGGSS